MNRGCKKRDVFGMSIGSPDFIQDRAFRGFLVIREQELLFFDVVKKNDLRFLRHGPSELLRSEGASGPGSFLRGEEDLPGTGDPEGFLQEVREGEAGADVLACRQSVLHEAFRIDGGASLSQRHDTRRCQGVSSQLEDSQGVGQAVYAGTTQAGWHSRPGGDRDRRSLDEEGANLSDRGERSDATPTNLVWRNRPLHREHGSILHLAGTQEGQEDPSGGDGHVEGLREVGREEYPGRRDSVRQVSYHATFGQGARYDSQAGVPAALREGSTIYQGAKIHALVSPGESLAGWKKESSPAFGGQQTVEHGLPPQRVLWTALGLHHRRLGQTFLRELEGFSQMAAIKTVRGVRQTDRAALGGDRCLLPTRKQSLLGICRRLEQQDPGLAEKGLWLTRRRIPSTQNPDLHAQGDLN